MEPIFLICIGAALFAHAWYAMGMYNDGRTTGIVVGALGAGALIALTVDPVLMGVETSGALPPGTAFFGDKLAFERNEPRTSRALKRREWLDAGLRAVAHADWTVWLSIAVSGLLLGLVGIVLFFNLALTLRALNALAAWTMLVFSVVLTAIGVAILTTGIG